MSHNRPFLLLPVMIAFAANAGAVEVNNLKAGELKNAGITADETTLTVKGEMDASDFFYIFDNLNNLNKIDLSGVTVVAYAGKPLPYMGASSSPAGTLPSYSLTGLTNLTDITLPAGLKVIGDGALSGTGITRLSVPDGVTTIGNYALMRCANLESVDMKDNVTRIGTRAFAYCPKLSAVTISSGLTEVPEGLFEACGGLKSLDLDHLAKCKSIGPWALAQCNGIETLILPSDSETIGKCAMYGASVVQTLELPATISNIDLGAMGGMNSLKTLRAEKLTTIPELGDRVWSGTEQPTVTLVVANDLASEFKAAPQWKEFIVTPLSEFENSTNNIESAMSSGKLKITISGGVMTVSANGQELGTVSVFNTAGLRVATAKAGQKASFNVNSWARGVYLVVSNSGVAKISI